MRKVIEQDLLLVSALDQDWTTHWNNIHCRCVKEIREQNLSASESANYRNSYMANYCEQIMIIAKKAYYDGNGIMPDKSFNRIESYLKALRPDSFMLEKVG